PLPPSHPNKPCLFAYISKGSITIVSKKPVSWCGGFRSLKGPSVDEKNILPTVVVVIKKGCAATRRFKNIFVFGGPAKNGRHGETRPSSNIFKPYSEALYFRRRLCLTPLCSPGQGCS